MKHGTYTINKTLLAELCERFGLGEFTNQDAYDAYRPRTEAWHKRTGMAFAWSEWQEMNVRNTLIGATDAGILTRVRPGVYRFNYEYAKS